MRLTSTPARTSKGMGHHTGVPLKPSQAGNVVNSQVWRWLTRTRYPQATADTGTPMAAARTRSWM